MDGSNDARAYLYHRMFISNKDYLKEYFDTIGVDWYVRLMRNNEIECDATGYAFFKPNFGFLFSIAGIITFNIDKPVSVINFNTVFHFIK